MIDNPPRVVAGHDPTWCPSCGRDLAVAKAEAVSQMRSASAHHRVAKPARVRKAPPEDQRVRCFVLDVLHWGVQVARVDRAARGDASPLAGMLARVELYGYDPSGNRIEGAKIGRGVRGTHGAVEGGVYDEPDPIHVDHVLQARYDALRSLDRATADAIVEDGAGETPVERFFGARAHLLELPQRVAFKVAAIRDVERWASKLTAGDDAPALAASKRYGNVRIASASAAWWRVSAP